MRLTLGEKTVTTSRRVLLTNSFHASRLDCSERANFKRDCNRFYYRFSRKFNRRRNCDDYLRGQRRRQDHDDQSGWNLPRRIGSGTYNVSASAPGFETTVNKGLIVPGTAIVTASLELKVGTTSDKVEVSADNAVLNTDNGQISGTIGELEISSLPIASLNPYELALTLPGVMNTQVGGFSNGVDFNVGGGRPRANNFLIEGQDNNDAGIQGQGLQPGNDEAVKEVVIIENAYTAEYGHGAGSVSNLIYKSGTNKFHGAVYERLQNSSLDTIDKSEHYYSMIWSGGGTESINKSPSTARTCRASHRRTHHQEQALRLRVLPVGFLPLHRKLFATDRSDRERLCHATNCFVPTLASPT